MIFNDYDMFNNLSQKWKHLKLNNKSLLSKAFILIISSIILQLLGFVFRIEITRHSGTQALAIYQLIMSGYNIIMAFSLQGITLAASRYSAQQFKIKNYDGLCYTKRLSKLWFLILFAIIFIPCLIFKSFVAKNILGDSRTELGLIFILINIFLTGFENINKSIFIGTQKVFHTTVSEISELTIRIISVIFLLNLTKGMKDEISAAV
ncbi:MAG: oligosaccharide flippase family protein, partial [Clostridia bacterium]